MSISADVIAAARDGLVYVPLGGAGEIGMNMYVYGCRGKWIAVECGVTFGDETTPGIDVITADPAFLEEIRDDLLGIVLTHAHEDHQGAVAYLWPKLECPVYATAFTAGVVREKLVEAGIEREADLREIAPGAEIGLGPFRVRLVTVTHSIPEANALAISTPLGRILHTGDFKIDPDPLIGDTTDEEALRAFGDQGVLAMICDSTNVFVPGTSGSEARVREALGEVIARYDKRIAVACFASNIARVESIAKSAHANGREVALVGRSLWRLTEIARGCGYLADVPPFLTEYDAGFLPRDKILMICTGSQGERGSALARIAANDHANIVLEEGDAVLFSSRKIPGNERAIYAMQDRLAARGVTVVGERDAPIHASGHPARDELARYYEWVRPALAVPMHGEHRHLMEHVAYARSLGTPEARAVANGMALKIAPGDPEFVGRVPVGRLGLDGRRLVSLDDDVLRERRRMNFSGLAFVSLGLADDGAPLGPPQVSLRGLATGAEAAALAGELVEVVERVVRQTRARRRNVDRLTEDVRRAVRGACRRALGKSPVVEVHVFRP